MLRQINIKQSYLLQAKQYLTNNIYDLSYYNRQLKYLYETKPLSQANGTKCHICKGKGWLNNNKKNNKKIMYSQHFEYDLCFMCRGTGDI
jgi:hypothetical protein